VIYEPGPIISSVESALLGAADAGYACDESDPRTANTAAAWRSAWARSRDNVASEIMRQQTAIKIC
jgi:hypothetical protein